MALVSIGKIVAAHGVKGLVKILPYGGDISLLKGEVFTKDNAPLEITLKNSAGKYILASVKNITDRDQAEDIAGTEIFTTQENLPDLNDNQYYIKDLIGLSAVEDGKTIGKIIAIDNFGAGDLIEIKPKSGDSFYVPFQDDIVKVKINEGLIELTGHKRFILS